MCYEYLLKKKSTNSYMSESIELNDWDNCDVLKTSVLRGIYAHGFDKPSPIQRKGIVPLVTEITINEKEKRRPDIIAQAQS